MNSGRQPSPFSRPCAARVACALLLGVLAYPGLAQTQSGSADEYEIRAAMLLNIARFIDWPAWKFEGDHPGFLICVLGSDPIDGYADRYLDHQLVGGKQTQVVHIRSTLKAGPCNMLYAGADSRKQVEKAGADLERNAVLTISESSSATAPEQVIGLPAMEDHIKIEVNLGVAQRSKLQISSRLLRLAKVSP